MQRTYQAHFFDEGHGCFSVTFHDLPGCITSGSSFDEAKLMSAEVLQFFIDELVVDAEDVPEPTCWTTPLRQNETLVEVPVRVPRYGYLAFPLGFLKRQTEHQRTALLAVFSKEVMRSALQAICSKYDRVLWRDEKEVYVLRRDQKGVLRGWPVGRSEFKQIVEEMNRVPTDAEFEVILANLNAEIAGLEQRVGLDHRTLAEELHAGRFQETMEMCELLMLVDQRDEVVARRERQAKAGMVPPP